MKLSPEKKYDEPKHVLNSREFAGFAQGLHSKYPLVEFRVDPVTENTIADSPSLVEESKRQELFETAESFMEEGDITDIESATSSLVRVWISSDSQGEIKKSITELNHQAIILSGQVNDNSGIHESTIGRSLDKVLGHRPQREDLPKYEQIIGYRFFDEPTA